MRKGQAALEFLMTYGWAILAAVIVIGVLAYFGVFSPSKYVSKICTIGAPFGCDESAISATGVRIIIRNGYGDNVDISSIYLSNCATATTGWTNPVADGSTVDVTIPCTITGKFRGDIAISYKKTGGAILQNATGSISGSVA